jgi:hypothetical protein
MTTPIIGLGRAMGCRDQAAVVSSSAVSTLVTESTLVKCVVVI